MISKSTALVAKKPDKGTNKRPKVALVLSGGGIRGVAHVGVLEILQQANIGIDLIVGCSAGALVGGLYADKNEIEHVKKIALEMTPFSRNYNLFGMPSLSKLIKGYGCFSMKRIADYLAKYIQATTFQQLQSPLAVVATNLNEYNLKTFSKGPLIQAICASCAIPGIFQPIYIENQYYVDGYILDPLPISVAKNLGAQFIIGVNICSNSEKLTPSKPFNTVLHSLNIMTKHRIEESLKQVDLILDLDLVNVGRLFTSKKGAIGLYEAGKKATEKMLPIIQERIAMLV